MLHGLCCEEHRCVYIAQRMHVYAFLQHNNYNTEWSSGHVMGNDQRERWWEGEGGGGEQRVVVGSGDLEWWWEAESGGGER